MEKKRAVILFADILGSTEFAAMQTPERYNEMLRAFHQMAHQVIDDYKRSEKLTDQRLHAGGTADECHVFLVGGQPNEDERHALRLAVRLKQGWINSQLGKELTDGAQNPNGIKVDLRVGIGCGEVVFDEDVWTGRSTPEGFYISQAKRIESLAEKYAASTLILVKQEVKDAVQGAEGQNIEFGPPPDLSPGETKGLLQGNDELTIYPVLRYAEFATVQQETTPRPQTALDYALLAQALNRSGDFEGAIKNYRQVVKLAPRFHEAWYNLGNAYDDNGEYDQAILAYRKAAQVKPDYHEAWYNLGIAYRHQGEHDQAVLAYQKAVEIKPDFYEAWYNLGNAYRHTGEYDQAIEAYQRVLEIKPDHHEALYNLGATYEDKGDDDKAAEDFQQEVDLQPDDIRTRHDLGAAYERNEQYDVTILAYQRAVEINPNDHETWFNLGNAYWLSREYDQAIGAYQKAVEIKPDEPAYSWNLACGYAQKRDPARAVEHLSRAIVMDASRRDRAKTEADFDPVRSDHAFRKLVYGE